MTDEQDVLSEAAKIVENRKRMARAWDSEFCYTQDRYDAVYTSTDATKLDVCKPGFFNKWRGNLFVNSMIDCRLGDLADGITRVVLQVIEKPGGGDVIVAVGDQHGHFTPCRHDGGMVEEPKPASTRKAA